MVPLPPHTATMFGTICLRLSHQPGRHPWRRAFSAPSTGTVVYLYVRFSAVAHPQSHWTWSGERKFIGFAQCYWTDTPCHSTRYQWLITLCSHRSNLVVLPFAVRDVQGLTSSQARHWHGESTSRFWTRVGQS